MTHKGGLRLFCFLFVQIHESTFEIVYMRVDVSSAAPIRTDPSYPPL